MVRRANQTIQSPPAAFLINIRDEAIVGRSPP
jgi:hypothetical protein